MPDNETCFHQGKINHDGTRLCNCHPRLQKHPNHPHCPGSYACDFFKPITGSIVLAHKNTEITTLENPSDNEEIAWIVLHKKNGDQVHFFPQED